MGFEPTTLSLARRCSTTEPLPFTAPAGNLPWCRGSELNRRHVDFQSTKNDRLIISFLDDRTSRGLSPATIRYYSIYLTRFTDAVKAPLPELQKPDLQRALFNLPCSPGGRHAYLRALRAFYSWAEDSGIVRENPCHKLQIRVPKPLRHAVSVDLIPKL